MRRRGAPQVSRYPSNDRISIHVTKQGLGNPGDVLVGIFTSGNSRDVINAIGYANTHKIKMIGLTGNGGGQMKDLCYLCLDIPSPKTSHTQDIHIMICHILCEIAESDY